MANGSDPVLHYECAAMHKAVEREFADVKSWLDKIDKRMWNITVGIALAFIGIVLDIILSVALPAMK